LALTIIAFSMATAVAQPYPSKPIRMVVPFPPGGSPDIVGRLISAKLAERMTVQVVVDNRGGAGGIIGSEIAARAAFREGIPHAGPKLLEPIMKVEVVTPEDYMGDVIGDLNSRRGQVSGMDSRGNARVINAMVPLANMFGYVNTLRSMSQGRAQFTMEFDHYEQVPSNVSDEIKAKMAG